MPGNLWKEESSRCRYVEKMDIASCMVTGPPSSGGQHGYKKSSASWRQKHMWTAKFRDPLVKPPEKGEGPDLQDRQGQSRRQWAHGCRMGKIMELGEELDVDGAASANNTYSLQQARGPACTLAFTVYCCGTKAKQMAVSRGLSIARGTRLPPACFQQYAPARNGRRQP